MTDDQLNSFAERLVLSFETIAAALGGLNETYRRHYEKLFPEHREPREAVITRVKSDEDRLREAQGASSEPLDQWLSEVDVEVEEGQFVGVREREWLDGQRRKEAETGPDGN